MDFTRFFEHATDTKLAPYVGQLRQALAQVEPEKHGDYLRWLQAVADLPPVAVSQLALDQGLVTLGQIAAGHCGCRQHASIGN